MCVCVCVCVGGLFQEGDRGRLTEKLRPVSGSEGVSSEPRAFLGKSIPSTENSAKALRSGLGWFEDQQEGHGARAVVTWRRTMTKQSEVTGAC